MYLKPSGTFSTIFQDEYYQHLWTNIIFIIERGWREPRLSGKTRAMTMKKNEGKTKKIMRMLTNFQGKIKQLKKDYLNTLWMSKIWVVRCRKKHFQKEKKYIKSIWEVLNFVEKVTNVGHNVKAAAVTMGCILYFSKQVLLFFFYSIKSIWNNFWK